ncbi:MAG TPA: helix-turn-helix domain-containing protein [Candidatus Thermoplasmatota archaeon]|nr:helix-turn-helix domain-containing protein [Candidatus Thermoplasmatota archaeon]
MARRPAKSCELTDLFRLLGEPYVLDVLYVALAHPDGVRFKDIQTAAAISPNTLSERLKRLVGAGLLTRHSFNEMPPRVEYKPTAKTDELRPVFDGLQGWSKRNSLEQEPA